VEPPLGDELLQGLWRNIASANARTAYDAIGALLNFPKQTVAVLKKELRSDAPPEIARLLRDLGSEQFAVRQKAHAELEKVGDLALPQLEQVLAGAPPLELRRRVEELLQKMQHAPLAPACLQQTRALVLLQMLDTTEARALIESLANGEAGTWLTREAQQIRKN
jgi:hypothetical protein